MEDWVTNRVLNNTNYTTITGISNDNPVGTTVCKYGRKEGFATGKISDVNKTVFYDYNDETVAINGLVEAVEVNGYVDGGDSGGPIYAGHTLYGVLSGHQEDIDGNIVAFFYSPIRGVTNFTVKTS